MESLESILEELQGKYNQTTSSPSPKINEIESKLSKSQVPDPQVKVNEMPLSSTANSLDSLLNDLRRSSQPVFETRATNASPAIARDLQEVSDQQKAKDLAKFSKLAEEWLAKLDPLCGEGLWFEEFAKNYPSRLEAAIALIQSK